MHTKPPLLVSASALGNAASSSFPDVQNPKFTGRRRNHELFVRIKKKSPCDSPTWPVGLNLTHFCCRLTLCRLLHTAAFEQLLCVVLHPIPSTPLDLSVQEEEDGSEDDGDTKTQFKMTVESDLSMLSILDHMDEEVDGFVSPVDELKNTTDMRLSNLHSATT